MADEQFHPRGNKQTNKQTNKQKGHAVHLPLLLSHSYSFEQEHARTSQRTRMAEEDGVTIPAFKSLIAQLTSQVTSEKKMFTFKLRNRHLSRIYFQVGFPWKPFRSTVLFHFLLFSSFID